MAFIHTNYLTGNDTTGDGSVATPYKTIFKALSVAASNDEIKVAGGQLVALSTISSGTFSPVFANSTITTSVSQVGILNQYDAITWEDNQFGVGKHWNRVGTVSAGSFTVQNTNYAPTATIDAVNFYKLDEYHYSTGGALTNNAFEYWNTTAIQPNGRTGIKVTGGWNSGYTSNANGWTAVRQTGGGGGSLINVLNTLPGGLGNWQDNLVFDKFLFSQTVSGIFYQMNQNPIGTTGYGSFAVNRIAALNSSSNILTNSATPQPCIWNPPGDTIKIYTSQGYGQLLNPIQAATQYTGVNFRPPSVEIDLYQSGASTLIGYAGGAGASVQLEGSIQKVNMHFRGQRLSVGGPMIQYLTYQYAPCSFYFKNLTLYANEPIAFRQGAGVTTSSFLSLPLIATQIEDIGITGPYANQSSMTFGLPSTQTIVDLSQEGKNIESARPGFGATVGATADVLNTQLTLSRVALTNLSGIQVNDVEGLKTLDLYNNIYYKDEVNNWLRITNASIYAQTGSTGGYYCWAVLGVLTRPTVPFTVTLSCKTDGGDWSQFGIQYGPQPTQLITQSISPTSTFGTFTVTVDPALYADWETYKSPLYFGVRVPMWNCYDATAGPNHFYVQTLSIL